MNTSHQEVTDSLCDVDKKDAMGEFNEVSLKNKWSKAKTNVYHKV